ncbi:hypothetical protein ISN44_As04g013970 [Arabidopsis suecica]|uniref:Uncharacterized protein n=2 Tax=Arabidopsis TaxID=3701 RepID=B3H5J4_ARATH|nr:uncharacterized protein AT4G14105 [Arabidopsis thaliana]AEE83375.1 hypothetical protein AT4G14105 [Arabidopsis thaliana]KAG7620388.1 hypothetical protein ISN44_As04g013970 [Arabidopsis suecica]|eukprot:NP_001118978.1 hypothetical protein AT4G14105 [Arabidopsis thaliana]
MKDYNENSKKFKCKFEGVQRQMSRRHGGTEGQLIFWSIYEIESGLNIHTSRKPIMRSLVTRETLNR